MTTLSKTPSLATGRNLLLLAGWTAALFSVLQVHQLEDVFGHSICGPWGCGPPVSALIGYHGFWLLLMLLPAWYLKQQLASPTLQRLGRGLMLAAAVGIVLLLAIDASQSWQRAVIRPYMIQRLFFRLATFIDFPLVQMGLIGFWLRNSVPSKQANQPEEASCNDNTPRIPEA